MSTQAYIHTGEPRQDDVTMMLESRMMMYKCLNFENLSDQSKHFQIRYTTVQIQMEAQSRAQAR
ncbi:hypothetical protein IEO21_09325 [Rhodonia placenta]|uniref:Uncharacterized protein n=1 Tax=Rhodonia placenta TaxID=104341 RepID=A0A8H7NUM1_9APHY|nr:hypothetical protein IEO21_09325 [Postia placenta]